tara:strand:+ start:399 stop:671 length:273 start_codon:yes stop_codon:yes gene_type:complete
MNVCHGSAKLVKVVDFRAGLSLPSRPRFLFGVHPDSAHAGGLGTSNVMLWMVANMDKMFGTKARVLECSGKKIWVWLTHTKLGGVKIEIK